MKSVILGAAREELLIGSDSSSARRFYVLKLSQRGPDPRYNITDTPVFDSGVTTRFEYRRSYSQFEGFGKGVVCGLCYGVHSSGRDNYEHVSCYYVEGYVPDNLQCVARWKHFPIARYSEHNPAMEWKTGSGRRGARTVRFHGQYVRRTADEDPGVGALHSSTS